MKKLLCLILCLMMILPVSVSTADESGTCDDGLKWKISGSTLTISGSTQMQNYTATSDITDAPWGAYAGSITKVVIGSGVKFIGQYAFFGLDQMSSISFPSSVTSIGEFAFARCNNLQEITIPSTITSVESNAFYYCKGLKSATIQNGLAEIPGNMLIGCEKLSRIDIPVSVKAIGLGALNKCYSLSDIYYHGTKEQWDAITFPWLWDLEAGKNTERGTYEIHYLGLGSSEPAPDAPAEKVTLKQVKIRKLKASSRNKIKVKWKKLSSKDKKKIRKIEIQYSTDRNFKTNVTSKIISSGKKSWTITKLKPNTKYYVRIRAYTKSGNVINVSKWSTKNVKTKKK